MSNNNQDRDLGAELLEAAREIKAHKAGQLKPKIVRNNVIAARHNLGLSQAQFAVLLGVSKRTLEHWEQERRQPSQAAQRLIEIALKRPEVLIDLFGDAA